MLGWVDDEPTQNSAVAERKNHSTSAEDRGPNGIRIPTNPVKSAASISAVGLLSSARAAGALVSRA